jgi:hypothetical protein
MEERNYSCVYVYTETLHSHHILIKYFKRKRAVSFSVCTMSWTQPPAESVIILNLLQWNDNYAQGCSSGWDTLFPIWNYNVCISSFTGASNINFSAAKAIIITEHALYSLHTPSCINPLLSCSFCHFSYTVPGHTVT